MSPHRNIGASSRPPSLALQLALIPLNMAIGKRLAVLRRNMIKHTDGRVKLVSEVITGIKAIKLYAWEDPYVAKITGLRESELAMIRKTALFNIVNTTMFTSGPVLVALASFGVYVAMGYELTASVAFPALALFNLLRFPILMLPVGDVADPQSGAYMDSSALPPVLKFRLCISFADPNQQHHPGKCGCQAAADLPGDGGARGQGAGRKRHGPRH